MPSGCYLNWYRTFLGHNLNGTESGIANEMPQKCSKASLEDCCGLVGRILRRKVFLQGSAARLAGARPDETTRSLMHIHTIPFFSFFPPNREMLTMASLLAAIGDAGPDTVNTAQTRSRERLEVDLQESRVAGMGCQKFWEDRAACQTNFK